MGFKIDDAKLRRAGLDYWHLLDISYYENLEEYFSKNPDAEFWLATTKGERCYADAEFADGCHILFGKETAGLPESLLMRHPGRCIRIPQISEARSLNLSNEAAVICYEALRRLNFPRLKKEGKFPGKEG
jgi:tRNA (cytidine/uridine-2'-O-)-methyltransferase